MQDKVFRGDDEYLHEFEDPTVHPSDNINKQLTMLFYNSEQISEIEIQNFLSSEGRQLRSLPR